MLPFNNPAHYGYISPARFNFLFGVLSDVCKSRGYLHWQPTEPSVLAACETPRNLLKYIEESTGREFPLEQTNQMWLEYQLLTMAANPQESPGFTGLYCYTQSNRDEKDIASRHPERVMNKRFGMFEIEALIDFEGYLSLMEEILVALGVNKNHIVRISYRSACIALGRNPDL